MSKKRILIVDDDPRNVFALKVNLHAKGFDCIACSGGLEALNFLDGTEIVDIVLMDMMMPGMDGYETIPAIKKIEARKNIPVIAVTAQAMTGDREKCLKAGADGYISKPIDLEKLLGLLAEFNVT